MGVYVTLAHGDPRERYGKQRRERVCDRGAAADEEPLHKHRTISPGYPSCHVQEKYFSLSLAMVGLGYNRFKYAGRVWVCARGCESASLSMIGDRSRVYMFRRCARWRTAAAVVALEEGIIRIHSSKACSCGQNAATGKEISSSSSSSSSPNFLPCSRATKGIAAARYSRCCRSCPGGFSLSHPPTP